MGSSVRPIPAISPVGSLHSIMWSLCKNGGSISGWLMNSEAHLLISDFISSLCRKACISAATLESDLFVATASLPFLMRLVIRGNSWK